MAYPLACPGLPMACPWPAHGLPMAAARPAPAWLVLRLPRGAPGLGGGGFGSLAGPRGTPLDPAAMASIDQVECHFSSSNLRQPAGQP